MKLHHSLGHYFFPGNYLVGSNLEFSIYFGRVGLAPPTGFEPSPDSKISVASPVADMDVDPNKFNREQCPGVAYFPRTASWQTFDRSAYANLPCLGPLWDV